MTSLRSSSTRSQESSRRNNTTTLKREQDNSTGSQVAIIPDHAEAAKFDVYAMGDVPKISHEGLEAAHGKIWVDRTLEQSTTRGAGRAGV